MTYDRNFRFQNLDYTEQALTRQKHEQVSRFIWDLRSA